MKGFILKTFIVENLFDLISRIIAPLSLVFLFIISLSLPIAIYGVKPLIWFCALGFWAIYRPDLLSMAGVFVFGCIHDLVIANHFGYGIALMLIVVVLLRSISSKFYSFGFAFFALAIVVSTLLFCIAQWLIDVIIADQFLSLFPYLFTATLTIFIWPLVWLSLAPFARRIPMLDKTRRTVNVSSGNI